MAANADVQPGDLLTTSGVDGVYPPGIPVAKVQKIERRPDSAFARIACQPQALVDGFTAAFIVGAVIAAVGVVASLTLIRKDELAQAPEAEPALDLAA